MLHKLYLKSNILKWILQKLLSNKQIGIVISDKTLCMGIDLPVRTCCLMEFNGFGWNAMDGKLC